MRQYTAKQQQNKEQTKPANATTIQTAIPKKRACPVGSKNKNMNEKDLFSLPNLISYFIYCCLFHMVSIIHIFF